MLGPRCLAVWREWNADARVSFQQSGHTRFLDAQTAQETPATTRIVTSAEDSRQLRQYTPKPNGLEARALVMSQTIAHPPVLWAQRQDSLYVTIDLQDCQSPKVNVDNTGDEKLGVLTFSGTVAGPEGTEKYALELELAHEVMPADTKISTTPRQVFVVIAKKDPVFWDRLQRKPGKLPYLKVDWNKWVDEDEMDESKDPFDLSSIDNFRGLDGMDGMDGDDVDDDSDDEEGLLAPEGANGGSGEQEERKVDANST